MKIKRENNSNIKNRPLKSFLPRDPQMMDCLFATVKSSGEESWKRSDYNHTVLPSGGIWDKCQTVEVKDYL